MSTDKVLEFTFLAEEEDKFEYTLSTMVGNEYLPQCALAIEHQAVLADLINQKSPARGAFWKAQQKVMKRGLISTRSVGGKYLEAVTTQRMKHIFNDQQAKKVGMMQMFGMGGGGGNGNQNNQLKQEVG